MNVLYQFNDVSTSCLSKDGLQQITFFINNNISALVNVVNFLFHKRFTFNKGKLVPFVEHVNFGVLYICNQLRGNFRLSSP